MTRWGVLTHVDTGSSPTESIDDAILLARAAEEFGFDSFWVAQHRFGDQGGAMPSPLVLLAAVARETTTLALGTASIAAAFEDPRRLIEDAAVVDALSGGRLHLGLGSGSSPSASHAWGFDHDDRHTRHWNVVDAVLEGAVSGIGSGDSRRPVVPQTAPLAERIWVTSGSDDGIEHTARRGLGLIAGRRNVGERGPRHEDERVADLIVRYRAALGSRARVALSRPVVVADDADTAEQLRKQEYSLRAAAGRVGTPLNSVVGSSEDFVAALADDPGLVLADHVLVHTRPLALPRRLQIDNLQRIAATVRPRVS